MEWFHDNTKTVDNFPWPEWGKIHEYVDNHYKESEYHELYCKISRIWCTEICNGLTGDYGQHESENFILVSDQDQRTVNIYLEYLEKTLKRVLSFPQ